jgi:hypothetical protein
MNNVSVPINVTDAAKDIFLELLKSNPEQLKALMEQAGRKDVDKVITDTEQAIAVNAEKAALQSFKNETTKLFIDAAADFTIPGNMVEVEVKCYYTSVETKLGTQVLQPGWHVTRFDARTDKMTKMENLSRIAKSTGGGGGSGKSVPIPQSLVNEGITKWTQVLERNHKERYDVLTAKGSAYSAPRELESLKDPDYLAAKAEWDNSGQGNLIPGAKAPAETEESKGKKSTKK